MVTSAWSGCDLNAATIDAVAGDTNGIGRSAPRKIDLILGDGGGREVRWDGGSREVGSDEGAGGGDKRLCREIPCCVFRADGV